MANLKEFIKVEDPNVLLPILESRHPHSCFIYNQVKTCKGFPNGLIFYTLGTDITPDTWIVSENIRNDYGSYIGISAPTAVIQKKEEIPDEVKDAFTNATIIPWDETFVFVALEKAVSRMMFDISINEKGNVTEAHPCNFYYMERDEALKREIQCPPDVEVRRLSSANQEENFIASTWKYTRPGSDVDIRECIDANASSGVFLDGKCVAGVCTPGYGIISSLYTLREYRNRGFGRLVMNYLFRECARDGCIPNFTVERRNTRSIRFNEGLGVKLISVVDWIDVKKLEVD